MPTSQTRTLLPHYSLRSDRYDECVGPEGIRPHWKALFDLLGTDPTAAVKVAAEACRRTIIEQDVSMNVYAGERSAAQPWPLDALPLLVSASDWQQLTAGLRQRAHIYNALLQDLYGPQRLLRQAALPAAFVASNPKYLRSCAGLGKGKGPFVHTYAVDLARSPDGTWWVIEDRLDAPSGLGYSLQNRIIVRQALPSVFQHAPVHRLYRFFQDFRRSMEEVSPLRDERRTVLLTPGAANETYFEHAYLARYLGYPLVEGADLTMRDHQIYLRTVGGLKRIDTIVRRVDSDSCDPLELNEHSLLGVPGLTDAVRHGRVAVTNQLGAGALESPALLAFLAPLSQKLFGEDLLLPSVATWWCGHDDARAYVLKHLDTLVIKPTFQDSRLKHARYGGVMSEAERAALARDIEATPWAFCGQERVHPGTTPAFVNDSIQAMPFTVRVFLTWKDGDYRVMPGGLTRFNPTGQDALLSLQQGSVTKDTWVLADGPIEDRPSVVVETTAAPRTSSVTASRLADNLFWFGRYLERTSHLVRMLGKLDPLLRDEIAVLDPGVALDVSSLLVSIQEGRVDPNLRADELAKQARTLARSRAHAGTLASDLTQLLAIIDQIKVLLPPEAWRIVRSLRGTLNEGDPLRSNSLREQLTALEALSAETLPHDTAWRFLEMGRRLERGQQLVQLLRRLVSGRSPDDLSEFRMQTVLHFSDNLFMFRSAYHGVFQPGPVFDWIICGEENPRGLRFQAESLQEHLEKLPNDLAPPAVAALRHIAFRLVSAIRLADPSASFAAPDGGRLFVDSVGMLLSDLSERVTQIYFAHAELANQPGLQT